MTIKADGCPRTGDFVCHLAVDLGCHWGVGFLAIGVDGCPGARDFVLLRASDSSVNLGSASGVPLSPGWSNNALRPTKPQWPLFAPCPWTHREIWAAPPAYPCAPNGQTMPCSQQVLGGLRFRGLWGVTWRCSKDFCTLFFLLWDFDILTRTHGKENGKDGELGNVG